MIKEALGLQDTYIHMQVLVQVAEDEVFILFSINPSSIKCKIYIQKG